MTHFRNAAERHPGPANKTSSNADPRWASSQKLLT